MAGYVVGIASETKAFKQGVEVGIIKPIEDAEKALDELGRSRGPEQLERDLKDASKATDNLADETKDTARTIEREYRDSYRKMKRDADDAFDGAKRGAGEFRDEAKSTARESAASFREPADALDAIQETAANALAGFGPAGAAAGLIAATGIGLAVSAFEANQEAAEKAKEQAAEWADAYIEAGGRILNASQIVEGVRAIQGDPERMQEATDNAREWGVTTSVALLAMAGDANALVEAQTSLAEKKRELNDLESSSATRYAEGRQKIADLTAEVKNGTEAMDLLTGAQAMGAQQADIYSESLRLLAQNTVGTTSTVDEFGDTVYTLPDGKQIYIDAETGQATEDVDAIERKIYSVPDKTIKIDADTSAFLDQVEALRRAKYSVGVDVVFNERRGRTLLE